MVCARKRKGRSVNGIVLLDKPAGMTSNRALQRTKRLYQAAKAGHTGSLDPLATGMLPLCLGSATKVSGFLLAASKTYLVTGKLGTATATGDADGAVTDRCDAPAVDERSLRSALERFLGRIEQVPPMFSALKHDGQRLYRLARRGVDVERKPRAVTIHELSLRSYRWPDFEFVVHCSKGTYVRSLVIDIAAELGNVGHVTALRRLTVAPFTGMPMHRLDELEDASRWGLDELDRLLLPVDSGLPGWPSLTLSGELTRLLQHGRKVPADDSWVRGRVRLYGPKNEFFGIGEVQTDGQLAPRRLFLP